jgi:hypothetical protein
MHARHPDLESIEVADQGHVPVLNGDIVVRIIAFVAKCETGGTHNLAGDAIKHAGDTNVRRRSI